MTYPKLYSIYLRGTTNPQHRRLPALHAVQCLNSVFCIYGRMLVWREDLHGTFGNVYDKQNKQNDGMQEE